MAKNNVKILISARDKASKTFDKVEGRAKRMGGGIGNAMRAMAGPLAIITGGLGVLGGIAVKTFMGFEQAMANVKSVSGATAEEFQKLTAFAKTLGKETAFSAKEAAESMYFLASAGFNVGEQMNALRPILDLAAATQTELAFSAEQVTAALGQFSLEAKESGRVADVFATGIASSQLTLQRLADFMPYAGSTAARFNWSLEETVALGGVLSKVWGQKMAMAGAGLEAMFRKITKADSEFSRGGKRTLDILKKYGLNIKEIDPTANKLVDVIKRLSAANMSAADQILIFGDQGARVWNTIETMGVGALEDMIVKMDDSGSASRMATTQLDTLSGAFKILKGSIETALIEIGAYFAPAIRDLAEKTTELTNRFIEAFPQIRKKFLDPMAERLGELKDIGIEGLKKKWGELTEEWKTKGDEIKEKLGEIAGALWKDDKSLWNSLKKVIGSFANLFVVMTGGEMTDSQNQMENFASGLDAIAKVATITADAVNTVAQALADFAKFMDDNKLVVDLLTGGTQFLFGGTPSSFSGGSSADDFISRPGMGVQKFSPQDTIVGFKGEMPATMNATVNVTIMGNANEDDVRAGVRGGLDDVFVKVRTGRTTGGF